MRDDAGPQLLQFLADVGVASLKSDQLLRYNGTSFVNPTNAGLTSDGQLSLGLQTAVGAQIHMQSGSASLRQIRMDQIHDSVVGTEIENRRARGSAGSEAELLADDEIGEYTWQAWNDGLGSYAVCALVRSKIVTPPRQALIEFWTFGSAGSAQRAVIRPDGQFGVNEELPDATMQITCLSSTEQGLHVQAAASQAVDIVHVSDSDGDDLFQIGSDGALTISTGTPTPVERLTIATSGMVINEIGADWDVRYEGDTITDLVFFDASTERVYIGGGTTGGGALNVRRPGTNTVMDTAAATDGRFEFRRAGTRIGFFGWDTGVLTFEADFGNAIRFRVAGSEKQRFDSAGNFLVGTTASPTGGGQAIMFGDNGGDPTPATNTAGDYAKDVAGTVERFVVDEAGNVTQITPHARDAPPAVYNEAPGREPVTSFANVYLGEIRWLNLQDGTKSAIETFAQYNARRGLGPRDPGCKHVRVWDDDQAREHARRASEQQAWDMLAAEKSHEYRRQMRAWLKKPVASRVAERSLTPRAEIPDPRPADYVTKPNPF